MEWGGGGVGGWGSFSCRMGGGGGGVVAEWSEEYLNKKEEWIKEGGGLTVIL